MFQAPELAVSVGVIIGMEVRFSPRLQPLPLFLVWLIPFPEKGGFPFVHITISQATPILFISFLDVHSSLLKERLSLTLGTMVD